MVCIVGVNIFDNKYVVILFIYIFGVGKIIVQKFCDVIGVKLDVKVKDLSDEQFELFCIEVGKVFVEGDLCCEVQMNIKCLKDFGCYCGLCYCYGFLVCGQCIKINVCICKGLCKFICK